MIKTLQSFRALDARDRQRFLETARRLFPWFSGKCRGAMLRVHLPSEGLSWPHGIGTVPTGNVLDEWSSASAALGNVLWRQREDRYVLEEGKGAALRLQGAILVLWCQSEENALATLAASALTLELLSTEDAGAIMSEAGRDFSRIMKVLEALKQH